MAVTPAFELPFEYPNATWKRALGSRPANTWTDLLRSPRRSTASSTCRIGHGGHPRALQIPSLANPEPCEKSRMASDRVELRCGKRVPWRAEHRTAALSPLAACKSPLLQVAVAALRGGAILELPSRNQPCVADRHRDGDGPVRVDESSVEKRTEQGRLSGGCAQ